MKKNKFSPLYLLFLCFFAIACKNNQAGSIIKSNLSFVYPSNANLPMPPYRHFYVSGTFHGIGKVPEDAVMRVELWNDKGEMIRYCTQNRKDNNNFYVFYEKVFWHEDDPDVERKGIVEQQSVELMVEDMAKPMESFRNATLKCRYTDSTFKAVITCATDKAHGLLIDDDVAFTDEAGRPYTAFPEGDYILRATLTTNSGEVLARGDKSIRIATNKTSILCRFHPDAHYQKMSQWAEEKRFGMNVDYIPGFMFDTKGDAGIRNLYIEGDLALYKDSHTHMFVYTTDSLSSSWSVELPYLYYLGYVGDPKHLTCYHYDIGEPELHFGESILSGEIVPFEVGDYLTLCRVDWAKENAQENEFDVVDLCYDSCDVDFSDGVEVRVGEKIAIMGVVAPSPAGFKDLVFQPENGKISINNRIQTIVYTFKEQGTNEEKTYKRWVGLHRNLHEKGNYGSMLEFYHIFQTDDLTSGKIYQISLYGEDKNGQKVEGTDEAFELHIR